MATRLLDIDLNLRRERRIESTRRNNQTECPASSCHPSLGSSAGTQLCSSGLGSSKLPAPWLSGCPTIPLFARTLSTEYIRPTLALRRGMTMLGVPATVTLFTSHTKKPGRD